MGGHPIVVAVHLPVQNHRRSARGEWFAGHLQFFWIRRLKTNPRKHHARTEIPGGQHENDGTKDAETYSTKQHNSTPEN
jgi:hypothetical protein